MVAGLILLALSSGPQPVAEPAAEPGVLERSIGINGSLNLAAMGLDWQVGHFVGFASGSVGFSGLFAAISPGSLGATVLGAGYTVPLSPAGRSMWFLDVFGEVLPSWTRACVFNCEPARLFVGVGAGIGFRYLHASGFTFGVKLPVLGIALGDTTVLFGSGPGPGNLTASFYIANGIALPILSFGYRFSGGAPVGGTTAGEGPDALAEPAALGVHVGANVGLLVVDVTKAPVYGFASMAVGSAIASTGALAIGVVGLGWSAPLGRSSWMFDLFGEVAAGSMATGIFGQPHLKDFASIGAGLGLRYLHPSGLTLGIKAPVFGVAVAATGPYTPAEALGVFYVANLVSLPIVSVGYRF